MMTRKTYRATAEILGEELAHDDEARARVADRFARMFKIDNGRFRRETFLDAVEEAAEDTP